MEIQSCKSSLPAVENQWFQLLLSGFCSANSGCWTWFPSRYSFSLPLWPVWKYSVLAWVVLHFTVHLTIPCFQYAFVELPVWTSVVKGLWGFPKGTSLCSMYCSRSFLVHTRHPFSTLSKTLTHSTNSGV
jgi:hypothetical protein